jgi:hypothetical protein
MSERDFPWGANRPTRVQRVLVALFIAIGAAAIHNAGPSTNGGLSDFSMLWYGARFLLAGRDPYALIGPHLTVDLPSRLFYPAPALVAVAPLTLLQFEWAATIFVFVSAALLAFGATRNGWQLLPIFPSVAFMTSARLGQWSILMTASLFVPMLAFFAIAKPQGFLPVIASSEKRSTWIAALIGAIVLVAISLVLLPKWPMTWWRLLGTTDYFRPPIATIRGAAICLVLLRWRRAESWLVFSFACMPQTWYPYNGLILFAVARTFREASLLSLLSSAGWFFAYGLLAGGWRSEETRFAFQSMLIAFGYLPATLVVLRRPNVGPGPFWLDWLLSRGNAAT